jgi:galactan 5-O-arabinofuranosyltransferase
MGSSLADRYLPRDDGSTALLAYVAQLVRQPDGTCPDFGAGCAADAAELLARDDPTDG